MNPPPSVERILLGVANPTISLSLGSTIEIPQLDENRTILMWEPDTCKCRIVFEHDKGKWRNIRVLPAYLNPRFQFFMTKICAHHQQLSYEKLHEVVWKDCRSKNLMIAYAVESIPEIGKTYHQEVRQANGTFIEKHVWFRPGVSCEWHFEGENENRIFHIKFSGVALSEESMQKLLKYAIELGRVVLEQKELVVVANG